MIDENVTFCPISGNKFRGSGKARLAGASTGRRCDPSDFAVMGSRRRLNGQLREQKSR